MKVTIERSVGTPRQVTITPDDPALRRIVEEVESHPEFALSRREIVKYIITPAGQRAKDVQTLLRLDEIEQVRGVLTRIANECKREVTAATARRATTRSDFLDALKLKEFDLPTIVRAINDRRKILGLAPIAELTVTTSFREGAVSSDSATQAPSLSKATALADMVALEEVVAKGEEDQSKVCRDTALDQLRQLQSDATAFRIIRQQKLVKDGLELIDSDACRLCDAEWSAEDLRQYLQQKIANAEGFGQRLKSLSDQAQLVINAISIRVSHLGRIASSCSQVQPKIEAQALVDKVEELSELSDGLADFVADATLIEKAISGFATEWWTLSGEEATCVTSCRAALEALPNVSREDEAKHDLSIAQERYEKSVEATQNGRTSLKRQRRADAVLAAFNSSVQTVLDGIYTDVADDFSRLYRTINREDEAAFKAELVFPAPAKLSLGVDFYGRGLFPPGAYHSEGHQDGMGLCLYLALMKRTLGEKFTFSVLDDVVMSVDAGHRRELCRLLKKEFPHTQFVLTTHDRVWLQYMRSEGLIEQSQTFGGWTVDSGPRIWNDSDVWQEIEDELVKNNVPTAAHYLRRYLEHMAFGLADGLRAPVEFRGDGQYDLGDLLPPALSQWQKRLKDGLKVAQRWKQTDTIARITALAEKAKQVVAKSSVEQWAINKAVHFSEWANLQPDEFRPVVQSFHDLLEVVKCAK